ncbi:MAG TPA: saccharopine dehydrogenase C-terminal domain-containing protein, partial [Myxococcota bacterium]
GRKGSVRAVSFDLFDRLKAGRALARANAVGAIGAMQHRGNLALMNACHDAGAHYCDLGGLFHMTRTQLKLDRAFQKAGLTAILGIGAAPGIVNVLARTAADEMDEVHEIHVMVGGIDRTQGRASGPLSTSYSLATVLDEASERAALFTNGKLTFVEPMSGEIAVDFGAPVGVRRPSYTLHSEVATLPLTYKSKGIREVSFRIAFDDQLADRLRFLRALGLLDEHSIQVRQKKIAPRDVLETLAARVPKVQFTGVPDEYEVLRVLVRGRAGGRVVSEVLACHCDGNKSWRVGVDVDTGCPPSIAMQMIVDGTIAVRGVLAPEVAIPAAPFLRALAERGMKTVRASA